MPSWAAVGCCRVPAIYHFECSRVRMPDGWFASNRRVSGATMKRYALQRNVAHGQPCRINSRRVFLRLGMIGALGLSTADLLRLEAKGTIRSAARSHSVILLWMRGGPSQHETWDPKPNAPAEFRGAFARFRQAFRAFTSVTCYPCPHGSCPNGPSSVVSITTMQVIHPQTVSYSQVIPVGQMPLRKALATCIPVAVPSSQNKFRRKINSCLRTS